jgi:hypothetical protein
VSLTEDHVKQALGKKYKEGTRYVLCEKGTHLAGKLGKGYKLVGKLADELTAGSTEMFILAPPEDQKR